MIIDCFPFYNELDMLDCRLEYLYNHVDKFALCESNFTHVGNPKPLYFLENISRYQRYLDKILYVPFFINRKEYVFPDGSFDIWKIELGQRHQLVTALVPYPDDTVVMISDLDEIPNIEYIPTICKELDTQLMVHMGYDLFQFNLSYKFRDRRWFHPVAGKKRDMLIHGPNAFRTTLSSTTYHCTWLDNSGWHLSYFMDAAGLSNKLKNFAHQEYNTSYLTDEERLKKCIENKEPIHDMFSTDELIRVDRKHFPQHFLQVFDRFYPKE